MSDLLHQPAAKQCGFGRLHEGACDCVLLCAFCADEWAATIDELSALWVLRPSEDTDARIEAVEQRLDTYTAVLSVRTPTLEPVEPLDPDTAADDIAEFRRTHEHPLFEEES